MSLTKIIALHDLMAKEATTDILDILDPPFYVNTPCDNPACPVYGFAHEHTEWTRKNKTALATFQEATHDLRLAD